MPPTLQTTAAVPSIGETVLPMAKMSMEPPRPSWMLKPVVHVRHDAFSRFVEFEGRPEVCEVLSIVDRLESDLLKPYIEPHYSATTNNSVTDADFLALIAARWSEYRAERYLQKSGDVTSNSDDETLANTPVQLFLAHKRVTRARLEIQVYSKLLKTARPALLQGTYYFPPFYLPNFD